MSDFLVGLGFGLILGFGAGSMVMAFGTWLIMRRAGETPPGGDPEPSAKWACDGCPARFASRFEAEEHAMNEHNAPSREAAGHILTPLDDLPDEVEA